MSMRVLMGHMKENAASYVRVTEGVSARVRVCMCVSSSAMLLGATLTFQATLGGSSLSSGILGLSLSSASGEMKDIVLNGFVTIKATCSSDSFP